MVPLYALIFLLVGGATLAYLVMYVHFFFVSCLEEGMERGGEEDRGGGGGEQREYT